MRSLPYLSLVFIHFLMPLLGTAAAQESILRSVVGLPYTSNDRAESLEGTSLMNFRVGFSAVVIDDQGHLLTLHEALPKGETTVGTQLRIIIPNGPEAQATIIRHGETSTGVLLKLDNPSEFLKYLSPITVANTSKRTIGSEVWSIGNAFNALEQDGAASFSRGRISGSYDILPGPPTRGRGGNILSSYQGPVIEVSAAVNDGNQGGALTNSAGQLIGLLSLGLNRDRKMGTAIPVHLILEDLDFSVHLADDIIEDDTGIKWGQAAQQASKGMTLIYLKRPGGPGNPSGLRRPLRTIDDTMPAYQRKILQEQWDRYYHFQQVFYTDQAVSALVIDPQEGLVLTSLKNLHGNAQEGRIVDPRLRGTHHNLTVIGIDRSLDLALLKSDQSIDLPAAHIKWKTDLAVGDPIAILGKHRDGGDFTMTTGVISAVDRKPPGLRGPFIQVDALANYGNLGGAIMNKKGEIIALPALLGPRTPWLINSGVSMASDMADIVRAIPIMRELGGDLGRPRPGLGVMVDVEMQVTEVVPESGAGNAGVQVGDKLVAIDDGSITDLYDLRGLLAGKSVGDKLELTVQRNGEDLILNVTLGQLE